MATAITQTKLASIFPEFTSTGSQRVTDVNEYAALYIDDDVFGTKEPYAKLLMVAHLIKLGDQKGQGPLTSSKVGELARGYANPTMAKWLGQTTYGIEFLNLVNTVVVPSKIGIGIGAAG